MEVWKGRRQVGRPKGKVRRVRMKRAQGRKKGGEESRRERKNMGKKEVI